MDFGLLPPEVNSGRMYDGPGSEPMLATAVAWGELADELFLTAANYHSVTVQLAGGPWLGHASESMVHAALRYVSWLNMTAVLAEEAASQSRAAATIQETARSTTVPPAVIGANRTWRRFLAASNALAQYSPAIAAAESRYDEMWAQDAAAMYRYADLSSIVAKVTAFDQPPAVTNPPALSAHREVVAQSAMPVGTVSSYVQEIMAAGAQLISAVPRALQALASPSGPNCQPAPPVSFANVDIPVSAGMSQAAVLGKLSVPRHWHTAASAPPPAVVLSPLCTAWSPELPHPAGAAKWGAAPGPGVIPRWPLGG